MHIDSLSAPSRRRSIGGGAYMPTFSRGLFSILRLGTITLAGFARLVVLSCRHHFELEFLTRVPSSLKTAFTSESKKESVRKKQAERDMRERKSERESKRAREQERTIERKRERGREIERERARR